MAYQGTLSINGCVNIVAITGLQPLQNMSKLCGQEE